MISTKIQVQNIQSKKLTGQLNGKTEINYFLFRGGTSQGPIVMESWLPKSGPERDDAILKLMGSPHDTQVDGVGGFHPLKNKLCTVSASSKKDADIEYCVQQVYRDQNKVDRSIDCGNMLAAVAAFAIESGLVKAIHPETKVKIYSQITKSYSEAIIHTPNNKITYEGTTQIDGVDGYGSPIKLSFLKPAGSTTQKMLPTGNAIDNIDGVLLSCVDVGMPMIIVPAEYLGKTGHESKKDLDADKLFMNKLEDIRKKAAFKMGLGDVTGQVMPKICLVASPKDKGHITARYMIDPSRNECHPAFAITALICLSAACHIEGTITSKIAKNLESGKIGSNEHSVIIEHPTGTIEAVVDLSTTSGFEIDKVSYVRTARKIATVKAYIPGNISEHALKLLKLQKILRNYIHKKNPNLKYSDFLKKLFSNSQYKEAQQLIEFIKNEQYIEADNFIKTLSINKSHTKSEKI